MDDTRIKSLLDEASERYNDGAYEQAITLWEEVQQLDPANQRAREGIRMARLLGSGEASSQTTDPRVSAALARVHELLEMGLAAEALEGLDLIRQIAPHLPELDALEEQARGHAAGAAPSPRETDAPSDDTVAMPALNVESLLELARSALAEGREEDAAGAAGQVLEMEPGNMEACGILSLTGKEGIVGEPPVDLSFEEPPVQPVPPRRAAQGGSQTGSRLAAILAEGQVAFDQGRMQDAIATWSRIFAVDPSNAEAGRRIDDAKAAIEEQARETDDLFYRAVDAQDAGRLEEALSLFQQVVQINPTHIEARNSVEELTARIEGGGPAIAIDQAAAREIEDEKKAQAAAHEMHLPSHESVPLAIPRDRPRPERSAASARAVSMNAPAPARRKGPAMLGGLVVFAVVGVGAWLWLGGSGGSMPEARATLASPVRPPAPPPAEVAEPTDAAPLQVVAGSSPPPVAESAPVVTPAPPTGDIRQLLAQARQSGRDGRWAEAVLAYREALRINPADLQAQDDLDRAMVQLEKEAKFEQQMNQAVASFNESDYGPSLHKLYRLQEDYPQARYLHDYIRNAWYNWGILLLQSGDVDEAAEKFTEVLELNPADASSKRARDVARRYHGRPRDSVLESFAASLQPRTIDAR